jgi:hypothetical protein
MFMNNSNLNKLTMDELASWSPWPARLLSIDPFEIKHKTTEAIIREFGDDKWGALLKLFADKSEFTLADVEAMEQNVEELIPCFERHLGFYLAMAKEANSQQIKLYSDTLSPHVDRASCLVELGAGYGSKLLALSEIAPFNKLPLYAAEYTQSGCDLIELIAQKASKQVKVGHCDFDKLNIIGLEIPENAIIFTSYSVHYVPALRKKFVDFISKLKPKVVVHFEPCYEYFDSHTLHGLMCKRYMELNGYTQNIASGIEAGCLEIGAKFEADRNLFGSNPFLPLSIIQWTPQY